MRPRDPALALGALLVLALALRSHSGVLNTA